MRIPYEHDTGVRGGFCAANLGMPPRIVAMSGPWAVNSNENGGIYDDKSMYF